MNATTDLDPFETTLRDRLHRLADHAPSTVPAVGDVPVDELAPRRARKAAAIGATIAVIAGGVGLTTVSLQGAAEKPGSATPEQAVEAFAEALGNEDLLGMIDVTLPEEVGALRVAFDDMVAEAKRLELIDESFALDGVAGVDVQISDLVLTTESLGAGLVAVSPSGGTWSADFDVATFPFGRLFRESEIDVSSESFAGSFADNARPTPVVAYQRDDRWYVSVGMTIGELIRRDTTTELPVGTGILTEGASTPEAAATSFYQRLASLELADAAALMAPGEGDVFRRYSSLWVPPLTEGIAGLRADGLQLAVSELEYQQFGDGDRVTLQPTAFTVEGTLPASWSSTDGEYFHVRDPEWPVVVISSDGSESWVLPAEAELPASVDDFADLDITSMPVNSPEFEALMSNGEVNITGVEPDGTIQPFSDESASADEPPGDPQPFRYERRDGCTTASGSPFADLLAFNSDLETLPDGSVRTCGVDQVAGSVLSLAIIGGSSGLELPSIAAIEDGGHWFVSPIGTVAAQVIQPLRDAPAGASIVDVPYLSYAAGVAPRSVVDQLLASGNEIPGACGPIVESDGAGGQRLVAAPDVSTLRDCLSGTFGEAMYAGPPSVDAGVDIAVPSDPDG